MQSSLFIRYATVLGLVSAQASAAPRIGELDVRPGQAGVPCFTVSEAEERRSGSPDFQAISVIDSAAKTPLWSMAMPKERSFAMTFLMCIPYAGRSPVLPQTPAAPLQTGRAYDVTIETRARPQAGAPHTYRARFCLAARQGARAQLRLLGTGNLDPKLPHACGD
ncbi:MAG: hypothetical protein V4484_22760 [Pseudomonadota bacterium]